MKVFKETLLILVTLVVSIRSRPASNPHTPCIQVDESTKDLVSEMLLLVGNLNKDVTKSKKKINANWLVPKHSGTNYPIYITWSQRDGDNIQSRLQIDHCIVKSFLPLLHCATEEFRNVSNSKGIVHKLKDLKWDSKNVIRHFQEARESLLLPQAANQTTVSICATPTCTVRSHGALTSGRRLIDMAVSHANTILEEIKGKLLSEVQPDLEKLKKQLCP